MRYIATLLILLPCLSVAASEEAIDRLVRRGIEYQLEGDWRAAEKVARRITSLAPDTGIGETLHLNTLVTQLSWDTSATRFDAELTIVAERALELCDENLDRAPQDAQVHYRCGQANFAVAFLSAVRGKAFRAGVRAARAIRQLEKALALQPDLVDPKLQLGMAWYYADNVPPFIKAVGRLLWFIPTGNSDKSLAYISDVIDRGERLQHVAKFIYSDIARQSDKGDAGKARRLMDDLVQRYPGNARFYLSKVDLLMDAGEIRAALQTTRQGLARTEGSGEKRFLLAVREVELLLQLGDQQAAARAFSALSAPPEHFPRWAMPRYRELAQHFSN